MACLLSHHSLPFGGTSYRDAALLHLEIAEPEEDQYTDTLSPLIFLLITLFVLLLVGKALKPHELDDVRRILGSDTSLLLFRGVVFSIFPVLMAVDLVRRQGKRIDRRSLRSPFYGQCFITAPFAYRFDWRNAD